MNLVKHERVLNWKFTVVLLVMTLFGYFVFSAITETLDGNSKSHEIAILQNSNDRLIAQAVKERDEAADERAKILDYTKALAERQRLIYEYLTEHGITLPASLVAPVQAPKIKVTHVKTRKHPRINITKPPSHHVKHYHTSNGGGGSSHGHSKSHRPVRFNMYKHHKHHKGRM